MDTGESNATSLNGIVSAVEKDTAPTGLISRGRRADAEQESINEGEAVVSSSSSSAATSPGIITRMVSEVCQLKWLVLVVACLLNLGMTYTMDFPGALGCGSPYSIEGYFRSRGKEYNQRMNQALYSVYSWPNTVLAIFGGIIIDKYIGLRRSLLLFTSLVFAGAFIFALGVRSASFPLMLVGRVVYGLGGESLCVAQSTFLSRWFSKDSGMSFAFGISISFGRLGVSFNFIFSPIIATTYGIVAALSIGTFLCGISVISAVLLYGLDQYAVGIGIVPPESGDPVATTEDSHQRATTTTSSTTNTNAPTTSGEEHEGAEVEANAQTSPSSTPPSGPSMKLSDACALSGSFWLLCGICLFSYNALFPFIGVAKIFFQVKYAYSGMLASQYISFYQMTAAIASPIAGFLVDILGRNTFILIIVSFSLATFHFLFLWSSIVPSVLLILLGIISSFLASALWPAVPLVVPSHAVAFSFGIMTSLQNIGLAIFPLLVGTILDAHTTQRYTSTTMVPDVIQSDACAGAHCVSEMAARPTRFLLSGEVEDGSEEDVLPSLEGFQITLLVLLGVALVSAMLSVALLLRDLNHGGVLTMTGAERKAQLADLVITAVEDDQDDGDPEQRQSLLDHPQPDDEDEDR